MEEVKKVAKKVTRKKVVKKSVKKTEVEPSKSPLILQEQKIMFSKEKDSNTVDIKLENGVIISQELIAKLDKLTSGAYRLNVWY